MWTEICFIPEFGDPIRNDVYTSVWRGRDERNIKRLKTRTICFFYGFSIRRRRNVLLLYSITKSSGTGYDDSRGRRDLRRRKRFRSDNGKVFRFLRCHRVCMSATHVPRTRKRYGGDRTTNNNYRGDNNGKSRRRRFDARRVLGEFRHTRLSAKLLYALLADDDILMNVSLCTLREYNNVMYTHVSACVLDRR